MKKLYFVIFYLKKIFSYVYVQILFMMILSFFMIKSMLTVEIVKTEIPDVIHTKQRNLYILDAGHGYNPKNNCRDKAYYVMDGDSCFFEYKFNIAVLEKLKTMLDKKNILYLTTDSIYHKRDLSVSERTKLVNNVYEQLKGKKVSPLLISIHANASTKNLNARGIELFTNTKKMKKHFSNHVYAIQQQIKFLNLLSTNLKVELPNQLFREHNDRVYKYSHETYEGGVMILDKTKAYSVLIEAGFYTNKIDRDLLSSDEYQTKIALAIYKSICVAEEIF